MLFFEESLPDSTICVLSTPKISQSIPDNMLSAA